MKLLTLFCAVFITSFVMTWLARLIALRFNVMSHVEQRSSHTAPTPRLGGIGIIAGYLVGFAVYRFIFLKYNLNPDGEIRGFVLMLVALPCTFVAVVGFLDDFFNLAPWLKLLLLVTPLGFLGIAYIVNSALSFESCLLVLAIACYFLFFTNAYNFMDGLDGFAGVFACVAAIALTIVLMIYQADFMTLGPTFIIIGSMLGFLLWNLPLPWAPKARIFMGDGGSLSTGLFLAILSIPTSSKGLSGIIILLPFIYDVVLTLIRRYKRGENLFKAHKEHLYQRLAQTGLTHAQVILRTLPFWVLCSGLGILSGYFNKLVSTSVCFLGALIAMNVYYRYVLGRESAMRSTADAINDKGE